MPMITVQNVISDCVSICFAFLECGCEILRIPYCLDNQLTDDNKGISHTHQPRSTPQKHYFSASGTHFC
jgi:hypothetical protein